MIRRLRLFIGVLAASLFMAGQAFADDAADGDAAFLRHDYPTAIRLLTPLLPQGDVTAELDIGLMYFSGNGLPQDDAQGVTLIRKAAQHGNMGAATDLGVAYAVGRGVPQSDIAAYMWFSLAAAQYGPDSAGAKYRDHVAERMTQDDLARAQAQAAACKASQYSECGEP